tara:strand:+ start:485 stop:667 length:183 start_codon:yes stop_codon:yes gene_type:complete
MSEWIDHVKKVAKQKGISYKEAMKVAKSTYKPKGKKDDKKKVEKKKKMSKKEMKEMEEKK